MELSETYELMHLSTCFLLCSLLLTITGSSYIPAYNILTLEWLKAYYYICLYTSCNINLKCQTMYNKFRKNLITIFLNLSIRLKNLATWILHQLILNNSIYYLATHRVVVSAQTYSLFLENRSTLHMSLFISCTNINVLHCLIIIFGFFLGRGMIWKNMRVQDHIISPEATKHI